MRRARSAVLCTALTLGLTATTAAAAVPAPSAAPGCVETSDAREWGSGELSACHQDGATRVRGRLVDLLPGGGFGAPDGYCVAWYVTYRTASGERSAHSPLACGHFGNAEVILDHDPAAEVPGITGVLAAELTLVAL
ncbi:hypothetical protein RM844_09705 [Streptomyces sp. DSM 44915]|uniref:Secreted protein n=1 Tax=Streptomyces chisholmiae TaxID=3075540 RepID=A0ABU2JNK5_9ACTN|nr:hypothetical protein [Streptomyces sp. DSM 44915]MDT0266568.1 hypothetical protein [Streptomyces sp. DSM 44915]